MKIALSFFFFISLFYAQYSAKRVDFKPVIDGRIENDWKNHLKINSFKQYVPNLYEKSVTETEVYFTYDEENIYIAAIMYQDKNTIQSNRYRRDTDEIFSGDWFQMNFDPMNRGFNGYYLAINPSNAVIDGKIATSGQEDKSWDGIWYSATNISDDRWEVEIQLPLNSIDFQTDEIQSWLVTFARFYTPKQERSAAHEMPREDLFRVANYLQINDLKGLRKSNQFQFTPYVLGSILNDSMEDTTINDGKIGLDVKYQPNSAFTLLATIKPDFAQLETDAEIINVSDNPNQFPEKRPFFTYNSDMYNPAPAVYTRNIGDIDLAIKAIHQYRDLKFDLTAILDNNKDLWYLGDFRLTDIDNYRAEIVGGLKSADGEELYNAVFNGELYFFNKTLRFYTFQELNHVKKDYYGTLTGFNYRDRNWSGNINYHRKDEKMDTRHIGRFILSNTSDFNFRGQHNFIINNHPFWRQINIGTNYSYITLASDNNAAFNTFNVWTWSSFYLSESLGAWNINLVYRADVGNKFRYRHEKGRYTDNVYWTDNTFDLVKMNKDGYRFRLNSDNGKMFSFKLEYNNYPVRQSKANFFNGNIVIKPMSALRLDYSYSISEINGSAYQNKRNDIIHRFRLEYNLTDKMNLRIVYQDNIIDKPELIEYMDDDITPTGKVGHEYLQPTFNFTGSWEYEAGSFAYLVFNLFKENDGFKPAPKTKNFNSIILKINKSFHL